MDAMTLDQRDELVRIIREVRNRWRWKVVARSLTVLVGAGVLTLLAAAFGLEQFRFSPAAIITFRIIVYPALVALGWFFFVRPLARHVTDQQVALYLEEHEPSLQATLLSAVDVSAQDEGAAERAGYSRALLRKLVETAIERCQATDLGRDLERRSLRRSLAALGGILAAATLVFGLGPAYFWQGTRALLLPAVDAEAASPYRIDVTPGSTAIARGADVTIAATLSGFTSTEVDLFTRSSPGAPFERVPMLPPEEGQAFESTLFALRETTEYFVQSAGVRSSVFTIEVADLPFVERLELEYVFPSYTGLPSQTIENGGDIAVLKGTTVKARVHSTLPTQGGYILRDEKEQVPLTLNADGTLDASFQVTANGFYRIDLQSPQGKPVSASPQYAIDVLEDRPPIVSFAKPGRDLSPTSIEEVFLEAKADDDFGVRQLDLVMSVNGGQEKNIRLAGPSARPLRELTAGETIFLEEMSLKPGDVVSYFARATDNDAVEGPKATTSDIYFLQIRPFRKDYRATESQAGGEMGQAGGQGNQDTSALSEQQRRIVAGTFNTVRDEKTSGSTKFREDVVFLTLAQGQLRERVETLATQIRSRVAEAGNEMAQVASGLSDAARSMRDAEAKLQARDPKGALPLEQQALNGLLRAEEAYRDVRVMMSQERGGQGGQGGGNSPAAQELADLFQLEMDKLRSQYETFQRSQQQQADNRVDEMLERLKELARRQEQEAERQRQLAGNRQAGGGSSAVRQRQLADETEEAARQLERLSREEGRPDLAQTAQQMREAAEAMRRAAANRDAAAFGEARAAAERLNRARDGLEQQRSDRMARNIENALGRVRRLQAEQDDITNDVRGLGPTGQGRQQQARQLLERKDAQAAELGDIERQLDQTASDFRRERQQASRKVQDAADAIRDDKMKEKIRYSKGLVQGAPAEAAAGFEEQIGADLESLEKRLSDAAAAVGQAETDSRAEALERARQLLRGVESMEQRVREQGQQAQGQQGQLGRQGQRGQQGQSGEEGGQRGQPGEQGQQGRGGQQSGGQANQGAGGERGSALEGRSGPGGFDPGGGGGSRRPGEIGPDDARQLQRQARERRSEAEALRRELQAMGVEASDLDQLIRDLRALDDSRVYTDFDEISRLQSALVEGFRRFEFNLRRELGGGEADPLFLSNSDEAPREYRKLIEDYYRALAREKKK